MNLGPALLSLRPELFLEGPRLISLAPTLTGCLWTKTYLFVPLQWHASRVASQMSDLRGMSLLQVAYLLAMLLALRKGPCTYE